MKAPDCSREMATTKDSLQALLRLKPVSYFLDPEADAPYFHLTFLTKLPLPTERRNRTSIKEVEKHRRNPN